MDDIGLDIEGLVAGLDPAPAAPAPPAKPAPTPAPAPAPKPSALEWLKAKSGPLPRYGWGLIGAGALAAAVTVVAKLRKRY